MKGIEAYQESAVTTQTKGRLVVMLYDGAIKFLKMAIKELESQNHEATSKYLNKAENIINELNVTLDMDVGGDVAINLRKLYMFMIRHLHEGNLKQDTGKIEEVVKLLEELNQSWKAITITG